MVTWIYDRLFSLHKRPEPPSSGRQAQNVDVFNATYLMPRVSCTASGEPPGLVIQSPLSRLGGLLGKKTDRTPRRLVVVSMGNPQWAFRSVNAVQDVLFLVFHLCVA